MLSVSGVGASACARALIMTSDMPIICMPHFCSASRRRDGLSGGRKGEPSGGSASRAELAHGSALKEAEAFFNLQHAALHLLLELIVLGLHD